MSDAQHLRRGIGEWLTFLAPLLAPNERHMWSGSDFDQFGQFLKRGAIVRQHEAVDAILKMVDAGYGHFGVTLLRPAYEELIWIEYLDQNADFASELAILLGQNEIAEALSVQNQYIGATGMRAVGFTQKFVKTYLGAHRQSSAKLREIGRQLGKKGTFVFEADR